MTTVPSADMPLAQFITITASTHRVAISTGSGAVAVNRADFLRAVETECNVLIIDRADLPAVAANEVEHEVHTDFVTVEEDDDPAELRTLGLSYLALAKHLEANPPVDQAQVEAVGRLLNDVLPPDFASPVIDDDYLRSLVRAGLRVEQPKEEQ